MILGFPFGCSHRFRCFSQKNLDSTYPLYPQYGGTEEPSAFVHTLLCIMQHRFVISLPSAILSPFFRHGHTLLYSGRSSQHAVLARFIVHNGPHCLFCLVVTTSIHSFLSIGLLGWNISMHLSFIRLFATPIATRPFGLHLAPLNIVQYLSV